MKHLGKNKSKRAVAVGSDFEITFPFSYETLSDVKTLVGRRYIIPKKGDKYWTCPINKENALLLRHYGFSLHNLSKKHFKLIFSKSFKFSKLKPIKIPGLKNKLYPFQKIGVSFINFMKGRALVADEMGLGKTVQALAYLQLHRNRKPVIIICPAVGKLHWAREVGNWLPKPPKIEILNGNTTHKITGEIIILNYDILGAWIEELKRIKPKVIITDECHYYKSNSAKRTKAIKLLAKGVKCFIALSGTPIENSPIEIFNAINIINPSEFPSYWHFAQKYCNAHRNGFGWDLSGSSNELELHERLISTVMIRRKKSEVLKELPPKVRSMIPFQLDNQKDYIKAEKDVIAFLLNTRGKKAAIKASNAEQLAQMEILKQLAVKGKMKGVILWIKDFLLSGEKLVVFAHHIFVIEELMNAFGNIAVKIDGSVSSVKRDRNIQAFQTNPKVTLIIGNIQAMGVLVTLTAASNIVHVELPWTPAKLAQDEDRVHRITQTKSVTSYFLLAKDTIEERIAKIIDKKQQISDKIIDGEITEKESTLSELINDYLQ
jgi:SWI/SNF-related matrix-associated actin-dependent regulator 1 of chromatin subfamily A